jgi:hypothetical protein
VGSASLSGAGTLTATGLANSFGAAALSGAGSLVVVGSGTGPSEFTGSAILSGAGTLSATGLANSFGSASLTGVGTLTVATIVDPNPSRWRSVTIAAAGWAGVVTVRKANSGWTGSAKVE